MRRQLRQLAVFTCITAASAFGGQIAVADTGPRADCSEAGSRQHHRHKGQHGDRFFKKIAGQLGLTDQQKTQAKALHETNRAQNKPVFSALMAEKRQLRSLIHSGSSDEQAIRAQAARVAAAEADLAVMKAKNAKQFLALLTPEQATKLQAIQAERGAKDL